MTIRAPWFNVTAAYTCLFCSILLSDLLIGTETFILTVERQERERDRGDGG